MSDMDYYSNPPKIYSPYLPKDKNEAMIWLKDNTTTESVILSLPPNGNLIPALSIRPVYLGHWGQTADVNNKLKQTKSFLKTENDEVRSAFLKTNKIDYLFFGPEEKTAANFDPSDDKYLKKVYYNEEISIYKVKQ